MTAPVTVRPARADDAEFAVTLIQATIGHVGLTLTGTSSDAEAREVMLAFYAQPDNRLSAGNIRVAERAGAPLGVLLAYAGSEARALDEPFRRRLRGLGLPDDIVSEGRPGEWYVDTLAVGEAARGHGVGAHLLRDAAAQAAGRGLGRVGLLVEDGNRAARLYLREGFELAGTRTLGGHRYRHLVRPLP